MPFVNPNPPPPDQSGGRLIVGIVGGGGGDSHRLGVHIQPFNPAITGSPLSYNYTAAPSSFLGITWSGSEATVTDTFLNLVNVLAPYYNNAWELSIAGLYLRNTTTGNMDEIFPLPDHVAIPGAGSTAVTSTAAARVVCSTYTGKSQGGGRFRVCLPAADNRVPQKGVKGLTASSGGINTALDQALIAYLTGSTTRIVAHNGGIAVVPFNVNVAESDRLRDSIFEV